MAKGKRAVALFEVINAGKGVPSRPSGGTATTPRVAWWKRFLPRTTVAAPRVGTPPAPVAASRSPEPDPAWSSCDASPGVPVAREVPSTIVLERNDTEVALGAPMVAADEASDGVDESGPASIAEERPVDVRVDRSRQLITFRFSYTSAAVTSFAILVVIGLAYVVGRQTSRSPASDDPFFSAPLRADVLEVARPGSPSSTAAELPPAPDPAPAVGESAAPASPAPLAIGRVIGLNYVVVQSFADEKLARDAQQMLAQAGIETTIERGLSGYAGPTWHCVVGTRGFESSVGESHPDFARYVASIREVGRQFAARTRSKEFVPQRYKWRDVR